MQERHCAAEQQSEALRERVDTLEQLLARTCEAISTDCLAASAAKVEHRLGLLEDELDHVRNLYELIRLMAQYSRRVVYY